MHVRVSRLPAFLLAGLVLFGGAFSPQAGAQARKPDPKKPKEIQWVTSFQLAAAQARKTNKLILAYFCGSDWCEWCKKLEEDVLKTPMFVEWAEQNVVCLMVDFPRDKTISGMLKDQNEKLKDKYNVYKTPTLVFLDADGTICSRGGYDTAKLRDDEKPGEPKAWIHFCEDALKNKPKDETLLLQPSLPEGMAYAKKHFIPLLVLVTKPGLSGAAKTADELTRNQPFIRFVNRNLAYAHILWPEESDTSPQAVQFREWVEKFKITPASSQLLVWDCMNRQVTAKIVAFSVSQMDPLLQRLEKELPGLDYTGKWLDDFVAARAVSAQSRKPMFIEFTSMDSSEYCQKFEEEIFATTEFKKYANKHLVLVRLDFPTKGEQSEALKEQNRRLADQYSIRGYPSVVILNPMGQKLGDAKYMKGGPDPFVKELDALLKATFPAHFNTGR